MAPRELVRDSEQKIAERDRFLTSDRERQRGLRTSEGRRLGDRYPRGVDFGVEAALVILRKADVEAQRSGGGRDGESGAVQ